MVLPWIKRYARYFFLVSRHGLQRHLVITCYRITVAFNRVAHYSILAFKDRQFTVLILYSIPTFSRLYSPDSLL